MVSKEVTLEWANGVSDKRDQAMMLMEHVKAHAITYMDQWSIAMEDSNQEGANQKTACGDGTRSLDQ